MGRVIDFEENLPHEVCEMMCVKCKYRFIGVYPQSLWLKDQVCAKCGEVGYIIKTGQTLPETEDDFLQ